MQVCELFSPANILTLFLPGQIRFRIRRIRIPCDGLGVFSLCSAWLVSFRIYFSLRFRSHVPFQKSQVLDARLYTCRIARCHCNNRYSRRIAFACRPVCSRSSSKNAVWQQPKATRLVDAQLRVRLQEVSFWNMSGASFTLGLSTHARLLPYMEQSNVYQMVDFNYAYSVDVLVWRAYGTRNGGETNSDSQ